MHVQIAPTRRFDQVGLLINAPLILSYDDMIRIFCQRRHELGITQIDMDAIAGLQDGYTGKLECGVRNYGRKSFSRSLKALGLGVLAVPHQPEVAMQPYRRIYTSP